MSDKWHILRDGESLTLSRHLPPRFDIVARTTLPVAGRRWVAHQIRQDIWRALRGLRGFSPTVRVTRENDVLAVEAGGRVMLQRPSAVWEERLAAVLENPELRRRWTGVAGA